MLVVMVLALVLPLPAHARPKVLVVLADHLTLADVTRPDLPNLTRLRAAGQVGLMSPGLPRGPDPAANVYATFGAGDSISVGDVSQGLLGRALHAAGLRMALIGDADGDDTGPYRPAAQMLTAPDLVLDGGTVPDPLAPGGRRTEPSRLWAQTEAALRASDLVVVHFGDLARLERENSAGFLMPRAYRQHRREACGRLDGYLGLAGAAGDFFIFTATPPLNSRGVWDRLMPILVRRSGPDTNTTLTSATTQQVGLVAARDLAPTVLDALGVPAPVQMTGAKMASAGGPQGAARLPRLDRMTWLNQEAQNPLFWGLGWGGALIIFGSLGLYLSGRLAEPTAARALCLYGVCLLSAWPLALLLAPLLGPPSVAAYLGEIAALSALIALVPSPAAIFAVTALALVADGLTGTALVSQSVLSAYALAGIRFYGIGNEYMGVLIGGALLLLTLPPGRERVAGARGRARGRLWGTAGWFALVTFVLSFPAFGAKAGGAITATVTFALAWLRLRGVQIRPVHLIVALAAGFALVFAWAVLGHALHVRRTHIETAVGALSHGRLGYILGVTRRKIGLAVRVVLHPGTLWGILALVLFGLAARSLLRRPIAAYLSRHPRFAAVTEAGLWGGLAAVLLNDSGVVAAILLLSCLILPLAHGLFREESCASWPWTSAKSASASPSATA